MLTSLSIKNYALIDSLNVDFNDGFSIITGETGAGKSILLGGLSLILGKRADLSSLKDATQKCIIEAVFNISNYNLKPLFESEDFDFELKTNRKYYLYVVSGDSNINNHSLIEGDGLSFTQEEKIAIITNSETEIIIFDLV